MFQFLNKHNQISEDQFDFKKGKSTIDAVVSLDDMVVEGLERRDPTLNVFLDLSKHSTALTMVQCLTNLNFMASKRMTNGLADSCGREFDSSGPGDSATATTYLLPTSVSTMYTQWLLSHTHPTCSAPSPTPHPPQLSWW
ncbi:hypothetical protein J6590_035511 [Homalodisca vitripennis]|nr:hypothetical protein J6590_035511 [Homalodisca vitripennis]